MRRFLLLIPFILSGCATQPEVRRVPVVIYHMEGSQEAYGITETHDVRYYIISGWTDGGGEYYPPRCMLLKVDREGKLVERNIFENLEWYCDFIVRSENVREYFLGNGSNLVKLDENWNILEMKRYETFVPHFITDQIESREYGAIYALSHLRDARVYKINESLEPIDSFYLEVSWSRSAVIETDGEEIYIAVQENDTLTDMHGYLFIKLNSDLDSLLTNFIDVKELFGYSAGYVKAMERFGDGTFLISAIIVRGFLDGFSAIFRVDSLGNLMEYDTIDYSMTIVEDMTKVGGGDVVLIGSALRNGNFFNFVMRLRPDLSVVWYREFLGDFVCSLAYASIIQDSDGNLAIGGYCDGMDDIAFMKLNPNTGEPIVWSEW